jgi:antagonist of KipI
VPPDGKPIVLMADRQTTGGYAKIAHIASVDLPAIAQCMPGDSVRFTPIELEHARALDAQREATFEQLRQSLAPLRRLLS